MLISCILDFSLDGELQMMISIVSFKTTLGDAISPSWLARLPLHTPWAEFLYFCFDSEKMLQHVACALFLYTWADLRPAGCRAALRMSATAMAECWWLELEINRENNALWLWDQLGQLQLIPQNLAPYSHKRGSLIQISALISLCTSTEVSFQPP